MSTGVTAAIESLLRDGVVIVPGVVDEPTLETLRRWRERGFLTMPDGRTATPGIPDVAMVNAAKESIGGIGFSVVQGAAQTLGVLLEEGMFESRPPRVYDALGATSRVLAAHEGWHRDGGDGFRILVPLDPFPVGVATEFVPGSHLHRRPLPDIEAANRGDLAPAWDAYQLAAEALYDAKIKIAAIVGIITAAEQVAA